MIGQTISHYRILSLLGEGGMGKVYRAEDIHLERPVAIKFLHTSEDTLRLLREAKTAASLSHPNICAIYEVDPERGFLAMELVEGRTLKDILGKRPLPAREAVRLAIQISEGLAAAHAKGIIHRDIKPANIMVTSSNLAKVMDFGLARVAGQDGLTREGMVAGTPQYMPPEQMEGKQPDARADIWAFGAVLHEALTGRSPGGQAEALPEGLGRIVRKALAVNPDDRYQHVDDLLVDLRAWDVPQAGPFDEPQKQPAAAGRSSQFKPISAITALAMAAVTAGAVGLLVWTMIPRPQALRARHLTLSLPAGHVLNEVGDAFALSSDGTKHVYSSGSFEGSQLFQKSLDSGEVMAIPGTSAAIGPFFSPDDKWVGFISNNTLKKVPAGGGAVIPLCDGSQINPDQSWTPDGILFSTGQFGRNGISRVSANGGKPDPLTAVETRRGEMGHISPNALPGGRGILFTILTSGQPMISQTAVQSLTNGERKVVLQNASSARYVTSGHLVFTRGTGLFAVAFDLGRLETVGPPVLLIQGVSRFVTAGDGTLLYASVNSTGGRSLVWVDRRGVATVLPAPPRAYSYPGLSPDGQRIRGSSFRRREPGCMGLSPRERPEPAHIQSHRVERNLDTRRLRFDF